MTRRQTSAARAAKARRGLFFPLLIAVSVAALLLRLGVVLELAASCGAGGSVIRPAAATDMATYMKLGREIAAGEFPKLFYYQPFYYAVFLPLIYRICDFSALAVAFVQAVLGAGAVWLAGFAAAKIFGKLGGVVAAVLTAFSTALVFYTPFHLNETLQSFNIALIFYLAVTATRRWSVYRWTAVGAAVAVGILTRGNLWLLVPVPAAVMIWSAVRRHVGLSRILSGTVCFTAALLLPMVPFVWHNTAELGRWSGPSTAADAVLALGNSAEAPAGGRDLGMPAGPMEYPEAFHLMMAKSAAGTSVPRQMWEAFKTEPGAFLELQFRKALLFWCAGEIPNNVSLYGEGENSLLLRFVAIVRSGILLPLAVAGLLVGLRRLCRRHDFGILLLYGFIAAFWPAVAIFYNLSRFRAPGLPLFAVAAGGFVVWLRHSLRRQRRRTLLFGAAALLLGLWLSWGAYDFYRENCEAALRRYVAPDGVTLRLGDGEVRRFDHGPRTFGGWTLQKLTPDLRMEKAFFGALPGVSGEFQLTVFSEAPGLLRFADEGGRNWALPFSGGESTLTFRGNVNCAGAVAVIVTSASVPVFAVIDTQRNYGRSRRDGMAPGGEWVLRGRFKTDRLKN